MWRAMGDEVRRTFAMSGDAIREIRSGRARNHPGWFADPHLRRGYLQALPLFLVGAPLVLVVAGPAWLRHHDLRPFVALGVPLSLAANALWFFLAARSRAREGRG